MGNGEWRPNSHENSQQKKELKNQQKKKGDTTGGDGIEN